ncbi:MAG: hypothetical protein V4663_02440 [Bacteroidota bacterium]
MEKNLFKAALVLTVIAGAFVSKASAVAEAATKPSCTAATNVCYVLTGPDGDQVAKEGVLVYPSQN